MLEKGKLYKAKFSFNYAWQEQTEFIEKGNILLFLDCHKKKQFGDDFLTVSCIFLYKNKIVRMLYHCEFDKQLDMLSDMDFVKIGK